MCCSRYWTTMGAVFGGLAVVLGAWAAHGLDEVLVPKYSGQTKVVAGEEIPAARKYLHDFQTAAEYQMYHALALVGLGLLARERKNAALTIAGAAFVVGIVCFSGSLYVLALTGNTKWGMVAPVGGLAYIVGWLAFAAGACPCFAKGACSPTAGQTADDSPTS